MNEAHHPKIQKLVRTGEWFVRACAHNNDVEGKKLILSGNPGVGKTHVAKAIYSYVQAFGVDISFLHGGKHPAPLWLDWQRVAQIEKQAAFDDVLYEVERSRILFLDDIGAEADRFKSGINTSRLREVMELAKNKWVLATTNLTREALNNTYDARVTDRIKAFRWLSLAGVPSYRSPLHP